MSSGRPLSRVSWGVLGLALGLVLEHFFNFWGVAQVNSAYLSQNKILRADRITLQQTVTNQQVSLQMCDAMLDTVFAKEIP